MGGERLTIVFMPESAYGPTNNCIGIGKVLERRGHQVVFAAEASWEGRLEPLGFEEDLVDLAPPAEGDQDAGQFWIDFVSDTAPTSNSSTSLTLMLTAAVLNEPSLELARTVMTWLAAASRSSRLPSATVTIPVLASMAKRPPASSSRL